MVATDPAASIGPAADLIRANGGQAVEFILRYEGDLPAVANKNRRLAEKHRIRTYLHRQLDDLWQQENALRNWRERQDFRDVSYHPQKRTIEPLDGQYWGPDRDRFASNYPM